MELLDPLPDKKYGNWEMFHQDSRNARSRIWKVTLRYRIDEGCCGLRGGEKEAGHANKEGVRDDWTNMSTTDLCSSLII